MFLQFLPAQNHQKPPIFRKPRVFRVFVFLGTPGHVTLLLAVISVNRSYRCYPHFVACATSATISVAIKYSAAVLDAKWCENGSGWVPLSQHYTSSTMCSSNYALRYNENSVCSQRYGLNSFIFNFQQVFRLQEFSIWTSSWSIENLLHRILWNFLSYLGVTMPISPQVLVDQKRS